MSVRVCGSLSQTILQTGNAFALRYSGARVSVTECDTSLNDGIKRAADVRIDEGLEGMKVGNNGIQHHAWFDSGYVFLRQSHDEFGIWFKEDLGSEVVFCFIAHVQAESSTMLGSTVDTCSCVSPMINLAIPSFEMSRSFLNQVLAHFDLLRNWNVTKVYLRRISRKRCIMS